MATIVNQKTSFMYKTIIHTSLGLFALLCIVPIVLVVSISFMDEQDIFTTGYTFFPKNISLNGYIMVLSNPAQILNAYIVTIGVTVIGTIAGLWLTSTLAYVISRKDYRFRKQVSIYIFLTMIFNGGLIPQYILISSWLQLKDTYIALVLPFLCLPYHVFLMRGFFQNTPDSIIESAKVDGANEFTIFTRIVLPISKPALATVGLFISFLYWNDWFQSFLFIDSSKKYMLQYLLVKFMQNIEFLNSDFARLTMNLSAEKIPTYSARMVMCVLAAGPMLFAFPFFQRYFVKGLTLGSVKG